MTPSNQRQLNAIAEYAAGEPVKNICQKYGMGKDKLYALLDEAGILRRNKRHSTYEYHRALELHREGWRAVDIARELNVAPGNIYNWTNEARMPKGKKPLQIEAYEKEMRWFEQAVASPKGIRITCADAGAAINTRMRMNKLRAAIRIQNSNIYPPTDPRFGITPFDGLVITLDNDKVILTKKDAAVVEEL